MRIILLGICFLLPTGCGPNRQVTPGTVKFTAVETAPMEQYKASQEKRTSK